MTEYTEGLVAVNTWCEIEGVDKMPANAMGSDDALSSLDRVFANRMGGEPSLSSSLEVRLGVTGTLSLPMDAYNALRS